MVNTMTPSRLVHLLYTDFVCKGVRVVGMYGWWGCHRMPPESVGLGLKPSTNTNQLQHQRAFEALSTGTNTLP